MMLLNWLKSIFGEKKENRTLNVNTDNDVFNSKYNQVHKKEEPKYIVSYDPIKDDGDGSMNGPYLKVENRVAEHLPFIP